MALLLGVRISFFIILASAVQQRNFIWFYCVPVTVVLGFWCIKSLPIECVLGEGQWHVLKCGCCGTVRSRTGMNTEHAKLMCVHACPDWVRGLIWFNRCLIGINFKTLNVCILLAPVSVFGFCCRVLWRCLSFPIHLTYPEIITEKRMENNFGVFSWYMLVIFPFLQSFHKNNKRTDLFVTRSFSQNL